MINRLFVWKTLGYLGRKLFGLAILYCLVAQPAFAGDNPSCPVQNNTEVETRVRTRYTSADGLQASFGSSGQFNQSRWWQTRACAVTAVWIDNGSEYGGWIKVSYADALRMPGFARLKVCYDCER